MSCCTRDEGRPLGLGRQGQGPNRRKLRRHNGRGGERSRKRRDETRQVRAGKTNESEPLLTCRKLRNVIETRLQSLVWDEPGGWPAMLPGWWPAPRRREPSAGSCTERGNLSPRCQGRPPSGRPTRSRVPMRGEGADGPVVAMKPGNAGGAKGSNSPASGTGQPVTGGAGV